MCVCVHVLYVMYVMYFNVCKIHVACVVHFMCVIFAMYIFVYVIMQSCHTMCGKYVLYVLIMDVNTCY